VKLHIFLTSTPDGGTSFRGACQAETGQEILPQRHKNNGIKKITINLKK
jgi:hypothetical protein